MSLQDVAGTGNRLVSLFVKKIRHTGMMGCVLVCIWIMGEAARLTGSCFWDAQTWRSVATGNGGDRSMSLQDVEQACQPVRQRRPAHRHDGLCAGLHLDYGRGGSIGRIMSLGRTDLEVCCHGGGGGGTIVL
ncbi:MAG: hypothetical protein ACK5WR_03720, partial [Planctomycetaceae bacterium]